MKRIFKMKWLLMLILMFSLSTVQVDAQRKHGSRHRTSVSRKARKRKVARHSRKRHPRRRGHALRGYQRDLQLLREYEMATGSYYLP